MTKSSKIDLMVEEMRSSVQELHAAMRSLSKQQIESTEPKIGDLVNGTNGSPIIVTLVDIVPLVTVSSLLIEIAARTEKIAETVNGLAKKAEFKDESAEKPKKSQNPKVVNQITSGENEEDKTMKTLQKV